MKVKIVTWLGGGMERIDFEGDNISRINVGPNIPITTIYQSPEDGTVKLCVYPPMEFQVIRATVRGVSGTVIGLSSGEPKSKGHRPVYSAAEEKLIKHV